VRPSRLLEAGLLGTFACRSTFARRSTSGRSGSTSRSPARGVVGPEGCSDLHRPARARGPCGPVWPVLPRAARPAHAVGTAGADRHQPGRSGLGGTRDWPSLARRPRACLPAILSLSGAGAALEVCRWRPECDPRRRKTTTTPGRRHQPPAAGSAYSMGVTTLVALGRLARPPSSGPSRIRTPFWLPRRRRVDASRRFDSGGWLSEMVATRERFLNAARNVKQRPAGATK
jgi:hypothetical protein